MFVVLRRFKTANNLEFDRTANQCVIVAFIECNRSTAEETCNQQQSSAVCYNLSLCGHSRTNTIPAWEFDTHNDCKNRIGSRGRSTGCDGRPDSHHSSQ